MDHVISIDQDGNVQSLYTDEIDLSEIGKMEVTRASTIDWNDSLQLWEVTIEGFNFPSFSNRSRKACVDWEIGYFNARLLAV